jgi:transcription elongation factor GreA
MAARCLAPGDFQHVRIFSDMKAQLIKRFEDEIAVLERELTQQLPKEIQRAREHGDLRENAEYHAAKERQRFVEARVSMLRQRVSELQLMNLEKIPRDRAGFGSKVTLREGERSSVYELVMPEDANPERGLISVASPIGRALVGKEAGDLVRAPTPAGVREFEILKLVTIHDIE